MQNPNSSPVGALINKIGPTRFVVFLFFGVLFSPFFVVGIVVEVAATWIELGRTFARNLGIKQ